MKGDQRFTVIKIAVITGDQMLGFAKLNGRETITEIPFLDCKVNN